MWRRWTGSEAQRLKSWENYQLAKSCYKDNFILCYERKYPEFWAWVKSPIVDGRSTEGKITKNCHPDSALIQRQRAQAVDHYNNVIKRNMTRLDRHMIHHFPEDAEEWKKAKDAEKKRKANNTKKDRAALAVPEAAYDALQPLALVQGESQPDGLIGAELNEPTGNFCFSILCLCLPRFLSLSCFFFKIVFTSAFTFTLSMPFYFGPGENPTVSTKASEEKSISSLFSSSRRVVQGETLADLSDQSFNSSIESGDSYLGDTIVEYPATLSLDAELDAELVNATDAKSDNTRKGRSACQKTSFPAPLLEADPPDLFFQSEERKDGRQQLSEDGRVTIEPSTPAVPLKPVLPSPRAILLEADPPDLLLQSKERKDGRQQLSEDGRATIEPSTPAVPLKPVLPSPRAILLEADTPDLLLQSGERKDGRQQLSEDGRATIEPSTPAVPLKPVLPSPRAILLEADPPDLLLQSKEMTGGLSPLLPLTLSMERSPDDEAHEETHEDGKSVLRELPSGALPKEPVSGAGHDEKHAAMMKMLKALKNGQETKFDELFVKLGFDPRTILPTSGALDRVLALSKAAFVILGIYPNQVSDILKRSDGPTSAALEHVPEAILKLIQDRSAAGRGFGPAGIYGELVPSSVKELMILGKRGALTVFLCLNSCALMTPVRPTLIFLHRLCVCASIHFFRSLVS